MPVNPSAPHRRREAGDPDLYDIVAIGGGFAGSAFTTLIRRWVPEARVLIVERNPIFHRKVGEATVEVSGVSSTGCSACSTTSRASSCPSTACATGSPTTASAASTR